MFMQNTQNIKFIIFTIFKCIVQCIKCVHIFSQASPPPSPITLHIIKLKLSIHYTTPILLSPSPSQPQLYFSSL